ncbi:MAG TPA: hypothetical protein VGL93_26395 [Streptosporangiaceae bacterium]
MSVTLRRSRRKAPQAPTLAELKQGALKTAERLGPYAETARDTAAERLVEARKWAAPRLEDAAQAVQETVAPRVSSALAATAQRVEPVQKEAKKRGRAVAKALKGQQQKKRRRWPIALLFFALGGLIGAAVATARSSATPLPPSGLDEAVDGNGPAESDTPVNGRFSAR